MGVYLNLYPFTMSFKIHTLGISGVYLNLYPFCKFKILKFFSDHSHILGIVDPWYKDSKKHEQDKRVYLKIDPFNLKVTKCQPYLFDFRFPEDGGVDSELAVLREYPADLKTILSVSGSGDDTFGAC